MSQNTTTEPKTRFPPWIRRRLAPEGSCSRVAELLRDLGLETVCKNAHCPNLWECYGKGTATFMILGNVCTRSCGFCAVASDTPSPPDPAEPERLAEAVAELGLRHVVVTSVTRDDLPDGGSSHFAATIRAVRSVSNAIIEVLTPDFQGRELDVAKVVQACPQIYNHNVETVPRLYTTVRPQADYARSLRVLEMAKSLSSEGHTKSGLMVGLGETEDEIVSVMRDLREAGCDILTIGQYLRPSPKHLRIERFVTPDEFKEYEQQGRDLGFRSVASGPFVRSSYNAEEVFAALSE